MRLPKPFLAAAVALTTVAGTAGVMIATAGSAAAAGLPAHVFAPYYEAYQTGDSLSGLSSQSGDKFLTMAFIQIGRASCRERV